ncbi:4384_t:CDS:1, partial [Cetraspora pellucida]
PLEKISILFLKQASPDMYKEAINLRMLLQELQKEAASPYLT